MTDKQWMAVFNLWFKRTQVRIYLTDIQPYNLSPTELERLIIDSFYDTAMSSAPLDPFHFEKLKGCRFGLSNEANQTIRNHLEVV